MNPIALPAEAILDTADRAKALRKGLTYTQAVAGKQAETAKVMLNTLAFSTQVADMQTPGTVQRQREFENVKVMAEATDIVTRGLMEVAKVMAGFTAPKPHMMIQVNVGAPVKRRGRPVTIDNEAPAYSILD
jgi:hypothetical protein